MVSCGSPPPRAAATPAAATTGAAAIHAAATLSFEQIRKRQCKQFSFGGGFLRYSSSSPHPGFDMDTLAGEGHCNVWSDDVHRLGLHEVAPAVCPRGGPGQKRHASCVVGTARSAVCTPTSVPWLSSDIGSRHHINNTHLRLFFWECDVRT